MSEFNRFLIDITEDNTVKLIDRYKNKDILSVKFKYYKDAISCKNALKEHCDLMNELNDKYMKLLKENLTLYALLNYGGI